MTERAPELSQLLTPAKVCWVFDVASSTLDEWTRRRELRSFVLGRVRRYEPSAVLDLIVRKSTKSKTGTTPCGGPPWQPDEVFWERINRLISVQVLAHGHQVKEAA